VRRADEIEQGEKVGRSGRVPKDLERDAAVEAADALAAVDLPEGVKGAIVHNLFAMNRS